MKDTPIFELENVSYNYLDEVSVLNDISLTIMPGEAIAILGANGSGKSTLLKLLDGLYFPTEGKIKFFGIVLSDKQFHDESFTFSFRRQVGLLFQDPDVQLFSPIALDDVAFAPLQMGLSKEEVEKRCKFAFETLNIEHLKNRPPYLLSGGEKKKVALASLLSLDPEVWLMDEPISGLDPRTRDWVIRFLLSLSERGKTLVMATHELEVADIVAKKTYVLGENHHLVAEGPTSKILKDKELLINANIIAKHSGKDFFRRNVKNRNT